MSDKKIVRHINCNHWFRHIIIYIVAILVVVSIVMTLKTGETRLIDLYLGTMLLILCVTTWIADAIESMKLVAQTDVVHNKFTENVTDTKIESHSKFDEISVDSWDEAGMKVDRNGIVVQGCTIKHKVESKEE